MSRRSAVCISLVAIALASCALAAPPSPSTSTTASKDGGKLVVALPGDISRSDPALIDDSNSAYVMVNVVEGLVGTKAGTTSEIEGRLATSWELSDDGLTYTFTLREGVRFHDGTTFDAAAVKFNYDRWRNFPPELQDYGYYAGTVFGGYGNASNVASVDVLAPNKAAIVLRRPNSSFLLAQTVGVFGISSPTALTAGGADNSITDVSKIDYAQGGPGSMVGTGPFRFKEWVVGDHVTIERNPEYWNVAARAHLDEVIFRPVAEETQRLNGLVNGEIDLAQILAPTDIAAIRSNKELQVIDRGESCNLAHIGLNHGYEPVSNLKIREAIAYAIDRDALIEAFYAGLAGPADNWMPLGTQYAKPLGIPTYDVDKAKALIAESGETDLTIDLYFPSDVTRPYMPDPKGIFEAIARDLEAVGFTIVPHTETWRPDYLDHEVAGNFEAWLIGWTCDWAGPDNFLRTAFFGYIDGAPPARYAYKNDELNEAMNAALAASDESEAKALWEKAQDLIRAGLPTIPLVNSTAPAAARADVKGFVGSGNLVEYLNSVWLDR